jgi:hypothetical protein
MAKELFESNYNSIITDYSSKGMEILQSHIGQMGNEEDVNNLAYQLEEILKNNGEKKGIVKRIFSLIVEALQNIRLHGETDDSSQQLSYYVFAKDGEEYIVTTANIILNSNISRVQPKIDKINSLDRSGLKEYYLETLTDGMRSVKGGAGLGFITVAMKSKNKIDYKLLDLGNEKSCFEMTTRIATKKDDDE